MEVNNTTFIPLEIMEERRVSAAIFGIIATSGFFLNLLPIFLTYTSESLKKNFVYIFVSNLNAADFMLSSCWLFGNTMYVLDREHMPEMGCRLVGFIGFITAVQEQVFPPLLAVNRYVSIYHQQAYSRIYTKRNMILIIAGSWLLCSIIPLLYFLLNQTGFDTDNEHCCIVTLGRPTWTIVVYWLFIIAPLVGLCDGVMLYCNLKMYKRLKEHDKQNTVTSATATNVASQNRELLWFLWADMALPICFHTVYHVFKFALTNRRSVHLRRVFAMFYMVNSCLRGLLTLTLLRQYRNAFMKKFGCRPTKRVTPVEPLDF